MKRIIYTAVALITCASVFGIADYLNAKEQGALVNYSDDVQTTEAVIPEKEKQISMTVAEEKATAVTKKETKKQVTPVKKVRKAKVKDTNYPDIIPTPGITEKTKDFVTEKLDIVELLQSKATDGNNSDSTVNVTSKRKISMEMFSRAPIREKKIKKK